MKFFKCALVAASIAVSLPLISAAQTPAAVTDTQSLSTGIVKKVDAEQGKITISHGPLTNLDMPAMTMIFRVADPKVLDTVKAGDNIKFVADKVNGAYTVTRLEKVS